jgi:hypothetical protein
MQWEWDGIGWKGEAVEGDGKERHEKQWGERVGWVEGVVRQQKGKAIRDGSRNGAGGWIGRGEKQ